MTTPGMRMGPVITKAQHQRVQAMIQRGIDQGAKVLTGGVGLPEHLSKGYFVKPTVSGTHDQGAEHLNTWHPSKGYFVKPAASGCLAMLCLAGHAAPGVLGLCPCPGYPAAVVQVEIIQAKPGASIQQLDVQPLPAQANSVPTLLFVKVDSQACV